MKGQSSLWDQPGFECQASRCKVRFIVEARAGCPGRAHCGGQDGGWALLLAGGAGTDLRGVLEAGGGTGLGNLRREGPGLWSVVLPPAEPPGSSPALMGERPAQ